MSCPINEIGPMDPENLMHPLAMNQRLRQDAPVHRDRRSDIFFISKYEDVVKMSMDHIGFSLAATISKIRGRCIFTGKPQIHRTLY
ncbi:MAG: hypothetical protein VB957_06175 [Pseudomonadales bacterium]|jgi:hypothetical protein